MQNNTTSGPGANWVTEDITGTQVNFKSYG